MATQPATRNGYASSPWPSQPRSHPHWPQSGQHSPLGTHTYASRARNSAADRLLQALPGAPVVTVTTAASLIGRTFPAANNAIRQLAAVGIVRQVSIGRRNRAYEAPEIITAFTALERQLATPEGDTLASSPARRVPQRPR